MSYTPLTFLRVVLILYIFNRMSLYRWSVMRTKQRRLIYTEDKPLGRLCKMCNPLFYVTLHDCLPSLLGDGDK
jgi:hypothetical protein